MVIAIKSSFFYYRIISFNSYNTFCINLDLFYKNAYPQVDTTHLKMLGL